MSSSTARSMRVAMDADELITSWGLLVEAVSAVRGKLAVALQAGGITMAEFDVLIRLIREPSHRLPMSRMAEEIGLTSGGFTKLADRMVSCGLLSREHSRDDRRVVYAVMTELGHSRTAALLDEHVADLRRHVEQPIGTEGLRELAARARALRDA